MANKADGSVLIKVDLSSKGIKAGVVDSEKLLSGLAVSARKVSDSLNSAFFEKGTLGSKKYQEAIKAATAAYDEQAKKIAEIKARIAEKEAQSDETDEYKAIIAQIEKAENDLERANEKKEKFLATGGNTSSKTYKNIQYDIEAISQTLREAKLERDELLASGGAYNKIDLGVDTEELSAAEAELSRLKQNVYAASVSAERSAERWRILNSAMSGMSKAANTVANALRNAARRVLGFLNPLKKTNQSMSVSIKNILKYAIGIRSLFALFNKLRSAISEGIKNLVQFDDTTNSNVSRLMSSLTRLKNSLATAFAPILNVVAPILSVLVDKLSEAATAVGMFFAAMTGQKTFTKAVAVQEDYAKSLSDTAEAAKKADKYLSGLDEIRTFTDKNDNDSDDGKAKPSEMFEVVEIPSVFDELAAKAKQIISEIKSAFSQMFAPLKAAWDKYGDSIMSTLLRIGGNVVNFGLRIAESTRDWFANLNWEPLMGAIDNLFLKIEPLVSLITDGLLWAYENVLQPLGTWTIEEALPTVLNLIGSALELISSVAEAAAPWLQAIWDNFLEPIAGFAADAAVGLLNTVAKVLSDVANNAAAVNILLGVAAAVAAIVVAVKAWNIAQAVLNALLTANPIGLIIAGIAALIAAIVLCVTYWDEIVAAVKKSWDWIVDLFKKGIAWIDSLLKKDWTQSLGLFGNVVNAVFKNISNKIDAIKKIFSGVIEFIKGAFSGDWQKAWDGVKKIFQGVWDGFTAIVKTPINMIIGMINRLIEGIVGGINIMIDALNKLSFDVPDWVPVIGGEKFGFDINKINFTKIPYLAKGAVIPPNAPFMAMLGDQRHGTNIEAPLDTIKDAVRQVLAERGNNQNGNVTYHFVAQLESRTLFEEFVTQAQLAGGRSGRVFDFG